MTPGLPLRNIEDAGATGGLLGVQVPSGLWKGHGMQAAVSLFSALKAAAAVTAAVLVVSLGACTSAPDPPDQQSPVPEPATSAPAFVAVLEKYSADMLAGGATAVIIEMKSRIGEWSSAAGVRTLEDREPVQLTDQTHIGTITTSMLAVSVMKLVEEGKIRLNGRITEYLPELDDIITSPGPVTVRSLLSHRSGIPEYWESPVDLSNRTLSHADRISAAAAIPWPAGAAMSYSYSGTSYPVLALLVEKLRGRSIGDVIRTDVVEPLNLPDTHMAGEGPVPPNMVHGYIRSEGGDPVDGDLVDSALNPFHHGSADTGMISTVPDLNAYLAGLLEGKLLAAGTVAEMQHPKYEQYGLGLMRLYDPCSNNVYLGHVGVVRGYSALALISADGSRQVAMAVARAPTSDFVGFDDPQAFAMARTAVEALSLAC